MKKITVFGSTGMLGAPVAKALAGAGYEVTALVRDPAKAQQKLPDAIHLLEGDLQNSRDVDRALEGAEGVYLSLSIAPDSKPTDFQPEREGLEMILSRAAETGLQRIGYLSSVVHWYQGMNGFDWWAFDIKRMAVRSIKASKIPYFIFYPSTFMEALPNQYVQGKRLMIIGKSEHPNYFIAAEDYADQVLHAFRRAPAGQNREYVVQGPDAYTLDEAADIFVRHTNRHLSLTRIPLWLLNVMGRFKREMSYGAHIQEALNKYPEAFQAEDTWRELGEPATGLKAFAEGWTWE